MVTREVIFYECQDIQGAAGFDRLAALRGINALGDDDWVLPDTVGGLAVIVDKVGKAATPSHLRFLRIRDDTPFKLSAARQLSRVDIDADEAISEFTYVVMWPDGFIGAVSSRDAPAHKKLSRYFEETSGQQVHIVNLFLADVIDRLKELQRNGLRNVRIKIQASEARQIARDGQAKGFRPIFLAGRAAEAATITVELGVGRERRRTLSDSIAEDTLTLAEMGDLFETLIVKGRNDAGEVRTINMKAERIRGPIELESTDQGTDVYTAIRTVRRSVEDDIGALDDAARGS